MGNVLCNCTKNNSSDKPFIEYSSPIENVWEPNGTIKNFKPPERKFSYTNLRFINKLI